MNYEKSNNDTDDSHDRHRSKHTIQCRYIVKTFVYLLLDEHISISYEFVHRHPIVEMHKIVGGNGDNEVMVNDAEI